MKLKHQTNSNWTRVRKKEEGERREEEKGEKEERKMKEIEK